MECSFVVLVSRVIGEWGKKGEDWGNIWSCACCQLIYAPNHTLITFCVTLLIRVIGFWRRDGINGKSGSIWCHVGHGVHVINSESMSHVFLECNLGEKDREVLECLPSTEDSISTKLTEKCLNQVLESCLTPCTSSEGEMSLLPRWPGIWFIIHVACFTA
jgi:hypothetical protein